MANDPKDAVEPEVLPPESPQNNGLPRGDEGSDHLTRIQSLLPSLPPSATEFFLSLWIARREVKAREAAAAVVRADRDLLGEYVLRQQALKRAEELPLILASDSARRRKELADAEFAALQAESRLEAFKQTQKAGGDGTSQGESKQRPTRLDKLKNRLFEESRLTTELQQAADEEIARITRQIERKEISKDMGERLIENIRDTLQKLLEEL